MATFDHSCTIREKLFCPVYQTRDSYNDREKGPAFIALILQSFVVFVWTIKLTIRKFYLNLKFLSVQSLYWNHPFWKKNIIF